MKLSSLEIAGENFESRLFLGTGKFSSSESLAQVIDASESQMVTVAMKRADPVSGKDSILKVLTTRDIKILPNTSGVRNADEAIFVAKIAREALGTNWLKLEIHPDPKYLMPDPVETLIATEQLVKDGFVVLPYCHADPVLCKRLEDVGSHAVMPLGSPIGSNQGLQSKEFLKIIIEQANVPVIVDAGIGCPSQANEAMEMGAAAVLVNTALASSRNPEMMAEAFKNGVVSGRMAYMAGLGSVSHTAQATSPLTKFLD
ncbi:MAG: thiazole synthase [Verrucomicrobiota bacterium]|nr:thiazole synthase [Verrucomicrobiota bacterium]